MIALLPEHLRERTRLHGDGSLNKRQSARFVLYWMRSAIRTDENPALDVARWIASRSGLPLLVYQAISEHYPYASDRHHLFMLQGARDVQQRLASEHISYAFHLANGEDRRPHLVTLANSASVVVTEDVPVDPPRSFLSSLHKRTETSIVCVDTACVAPMQLVKQPFTRAFEFRAATKRLYAERVSRAWPELDEVVQAFDLSELSFAPLDLQSADLNALVATCEIDHAIGPVVDTVGGSAAGYGRWNAFIGKGLKYYDKQRNNALIDGVSRMSAYLHYGMVSPLRIAREASDAGNAGAEKFLDELLVWRELAWAFCFYRKDHAGWSAIPQWAQETLLRHVADERRELYSWEQLARGETADELWNAAQKSLLMQGELHNNVRMTWGKAILNWRRTPQEALATMIDLNHRYALDGRDPASYGGLLWCLGQFDRPFAPEQAVSGSVRPRPTSVHAQRLDPKKYLAKVTQPRFEPVPHVAVIGAGISGLFAARTLEDHGVKVTVFEKSKGVGGRMATRSSEGAGSFDHGAQYFTARDTRFVRYVQAWIEQGIVSRWPDASLGSDQRIVVLKNGQIQSESMAEDRYVALPTMKAVCQHLARGLEIRSETHVTRVVESGQQVDLYEASGNVLGKFDRLVVSAPAAQTAALLTDFPELVQQISGLKMNPCWAAMVTLSAPVTSQWVGAFLHESFLSWVARNSTKPGRNRLIEHLVIHASPDWTLENWERDAGEVASAMLEEFWRVAGVSPQPITFLQTHRWKYAIPVEPSVSRCFASDFARIVACGDWASGSRVEGAFLSGMSAAGRILGTLTRRRESPESGQMLLFE